MLRMVGMKLPFSFMVNWSFKQIIQSRGVVLLIYFLFFTPFLLLFLWIGERNLYYEGVAKNIMRMQLNVVNSIDKQRDRTVFFKRYGSFDCHYVDHVLTATPLLEPEVTMLELIHANPSLCACSGIKERLELLRRDNHPIFIEEAIRRRHHIEEVDLRQKNPVEINTEDLHTLLSLVEGVSIGKHHPPHDAPQMIIRRFHLKREKKSTESELFLLEMHLTKRGGAK